MKKISVSIILLFPFILLALFLIYKLVSYIVLDFRLTNDKIKPEIKLSQLVNISEHRIKYDQTYYLDDNFLGFNAYVDGKYYVTVTKLRKTNSAVKIEQSRKKPEENTNLNIIPLGSIDDKNGRYIDLHYYPFNTKKIYYYTKGNVINLNKYKFLEVEGKFTFFNISFDSDDKQILGYVGHNVMKSVSFIEFNENLYIISTSSIKSVPYVSLHNLEKNKLN